MRTPPVAPDVAVDIVQQHKRLQQYSHFSAPVHALLALDAGRMGSWSLDIPTGDVVGDRLVATLLGFDFDAQPWHVSQFFTSVHPEDRDFVQKAVDQALSGENPYYDTIFRASHGDTNNADVWLGARGQVTERDEDGTPLRLAGVNWDATEQKSHEQKLGLLAAEMDHRIKNAFSVILALLKIGDKLSSTKADFATTLRAQVEAMATAHALSARMARTTEDADTKLSMIEIIEASLTPWLADDTDRPKRVSIVCDPEILVPPRKVSPLAMLLYEVSTNATKHGALAEMDGKVEVIVARTSETTVVLRWTEIAPDIQPQSEAMDGFGAVLLQHCAQNLGGTVTQSKTPGRYQTECTMDLTE